MAIASSMIVDCSWFVCRQKSHFAHNLWCLMINAIGLLPHGTPLPSPLLNSAWPLSLSLSLVSATGWDGWLHYYPKAPLLFNFYSMGFSPLHQRMIVLSSKVFCLMNFQMRTVSCTMLVFITLISALIWRLGSTSNWNNNDRQSAKKRIKFSEQRMLYFIAMCFTSLIDK